jgi:hypothetical protein
MNTLVKYLQIPTDALVIARAATTNPDKYIYAVRLERLSRENRPIFELSEQRTRTRSEESLPGLETGLVGNIFWDPQCVHFKAFTRNTEVADVKEILSAYL